MIEIKKVTLNDLNIIQNISKQSFTETFSEINTPENMEKYLQESFNTAQLILEINNLDSPFYIASWNTEPVGYLKLNLRNAQTEFKKRCFRNSAHLCFTGFSWKKNWTIIT